MQKIFIILVVLVNSPFLFSQTNLTIEGTVVNFTDPESSLGVVIPSSEPALLIYRNNSITSINASGYMLQAGDEFVTTTNNHLNGSVITGNKFTWNGTDMTSITHGIFTGYNINARIKYNYLDKVPMGIIRKSNGMTDESGVVAYNILKNPVAVGIVVKGMNGIKIYNNTFYSNKTEEETSRGIIDIYENGDISPAGSAKGTKIYNNIFYTKHPIINLKILDRACLTGFESDYNIFWCEAGEPIFYIAGDIKTFTQWQALGYDTHSVVINPNFIDFTDFVPATRLNYGTHLCAQWQAGLSVNAVWGKTNPKTTNQYGKWQVGARIY
jgi:hypothetical protein